MPPMRGGPDVQRKRLFVLATSARGQTGHLPPVRPHVPGHDRPLGCLVGGGRPFASGRGTLVVSALPALPQA